MASVWTAAVLHLYDDFLAILGDVNPVHLSLVSKVFLFSLLPYLWQFLNPCDLRQELSVIVGFYPNIVATSF